VTPAPGGRHPGRGTRNYLLSLGGGAYLEIIGPDEEQPEYVGPRWFGLDDLTAPRLVGWAMRTPDIERSVAAARLAGYDPGPVESMTRTQPDGTVLRWRLTRLRGDEWPQLVPFLIDWGDSSHPSATSPSGCHLLDFWAESPEPEAVTATLHALDVSLDVRPGERTRLIARVAGPSGEMTLG
jgi:hypothetical protein